MPWKMNGEQVVVKDGNPVWVHEDGKEVSFDAGRTLATIKSLSSENKAKKEEITTLQASIEPFKHIENPSEFLDNANDALETVKNLDDKKLVDAGEVERLKQSVADSFKRKIDEINKSHATKVQELEETMAGKDSSIRNLLIKGAFSSSKFIQEKTVLPADFAFDSFGKYFKVEEADGTFKVKAVRADGSDVLSAKDPGHNADPEEAIEILITEHPDKDRILRGPSPGSGTPPGSGQYKGVDLSKLPPKERVDAYRASTQ